MRVTCTSGSVRGGDGNIPAYSAGDLDDRPGLSARRVEPVEATVGIGLHQPVPAGQMHLGMHCAPIGRVDVERRRRRRASERPVVTHVGP